MKLFSKPVGKGKVSGPPSSSGVVFVGPTRSWIAGFLLLPALGLLAGCPGKSGPTSPGGSSSTPTPAVTATFTWTAVPSAISTPTPSPTSSPTATDTATATPTATGTSTPVPSAAPTPTATASPTASETPTPTATGTSTATDTLTPAPTDTPTLSPTETPTATETSTPTVTGTPTGTLTPTPTVPSTVFRFTDMDLKDPHIRIRTILVCSDLTEQVNDALQTAIQTDDAGDGFLDANFLVVFRPLDQTGSGEVELRMGDSCTAPMGSTSCSAGTGGGIVGNYTTLSAGATCLAPVAGTLKPYSPAVVPSTGPCFTAVFDDLTFDLAGTPLHLTNVRLAGRFVGSPASSIADGLLYGFLSEADAGNIDLPQELPLVGGQPLSALFPGGSGNTCTPSDKDTGSGSVTGWYFYFNFSAAQVPATGF